MGRRKVCPICRALEEGYFEYEIDSGLHQLTLDMFGDGTLHIESFSPGAGSKAEGDTLEADFKIKFCPICGRKI